MHNAVMQISAYATMGLILVLFILLVVVTGISWIKQDEEESLNQSTFEYELKNLSKQYRLRFYTRTGPLNIPSSNLLPGGLEILVLRSAVTEITVATVTYRVFSISDTNVPPASLGEVTFQVEWDLIFGYIRTIKNTSPLAAIGYSSRGMALYEI
ncbi:hypothetical protein M3223_05760 [Paenibacillus pasadenensis]|uniref:hypothetical protein n=1 Tax=Paenibacillus pasadenensis TaxID=217090 RepID=UPI002040A845|nr:hypothetical protein [Paenibacillus pasadenensis]MCM3746858.1 hypothetical protein [Paenibacillus pasadenensis]